MTAKVGIVGASGYGGAELLRVLHGHPAVEVAVVAAQRRAGTPIAEAFPNLPGDATFDDVDTAQLAGLDLVFLATPHGASLQLGRSLTEAGTRVVDLSGAFRLQPAAFEQAYGEPHPAPSLAPAVYGLTEFTRAAVATADLVANPGCYPTATLLGLLPLASLIVPGSIVVDAKSGTSGAGAAPSQPLHHPHVHGDVVAYGAPTHRHTWEIEQHLAALAPTSAQMVSFTPHLVPMSRGLLATCYGDLVEGAEQADVDAGLRDRYADEPFVHVLPAGTFPHTKALAGSNGCQLSATVDERSGRVVVTSAIDNLGKGAAGQAVQNANVMLDLEEGAGLTALGVYP